MTAAVAELVKSREVRDEVAIEITGQENSEITFRRSRSYSLI
jgi:hypothetical protein